MTHVPLLDVSRAEIKLGGYRVAPAAALSDPGVLARVQEYRRLTSARMYPLDRGDIRTKMPKADYLVSRKVDGECTVLVYDNGTAVTVNPGGTVRTGLPLTQEAAKVLARANVRRAMIAGELYVQCDARRPRVHDVSTVARQPQSEADLGRLKFAAFDVLALDGQPPATYADAWRTIERVFANGDRVHPVDTRAAGGPDEIERCFEEWVDGQGAEGLVARSDTAGLFKIKPRHTLDVAVIGFTESAGDREGMLHDLLYAVMRKDGTLQVLSRVGGGFDEDERRTMLADLKDIVAPSEYAEVNGDHVAYTMVRPEWVIEISCLDLISETTRGGPVSRMVLDYHPTKGYTVVRRLPLATVISPQFVRKREDKTVRQQDVRIEQVTSVVEVPLWDRDARQMTLPASRVLRREVYTKHLKGETMVRKFLLWETNKHADGEDYPAYVVHFTDFSPSRKAPLARDVRVTSSRDQADALWRELVEENVKRGWEVVLPPSPPGNVAQSTPAEAVKPALAPDTPPETTAPDLAKPESGPPAKSPRRGSRPKPAATEEPAAPPIPISDSVSPTPVAVSAAPKPRAQPKPRQAKAKEVLPTPEPAAESVPAAASAKRRSTKKSG